MPHQLNWLDRPAPQPDVWDRLNDTQRTTVIDTMARVIGKAVVPTPKTTIERQRRRAIREISHVARLQGSRLDDRSAPVPIASDRAFS